MKDLYNKYKNAQRRLDSLCVRQYKLEEHLKHHPADYTSVIANELLKADIHRVELKVTELRKRLALYENV